MHIRNLWTPHEIYNLNSSGRMQLEILGFRIRVQPVRIRVQPVRIRVQIVRVREEGQVVRDTLRKHVGAYKKRN